MNLILVNSILWISQLLSFKFVIFNEATKGEMQIINTNWNWSDAWLLMSIISVDKKGTDLRGIISTGDYINHSIFNFEEIKAGLEKLISIDYVRIEQSRYLTTKTFAHDYKKLKTHPQGMLKAVDQLHELLKTKEIDDNKLKPLSEDIISESILKTAYNEYMKSF